MCTLKYLLLRGAAILDRPPLRTLLIWLVPGIGRLGGLDPALLRELSTIPARLPVHYSAAALLWMICLRWRLRIPAYNIHHLIDTPAARVAALELCDRYLATAPNRRVARQRLLLDRTAVDSPVTIDYARAELDRIVETALPVAAKSNSRFERGAAAVALQDVNALFCKLEIPMFLVSGTLLGAVRDRRFVRSDYDIDVGFYASDAALPAIAQVLLQSRCFVNAHYNEYFITAMHRNGTLVDVFAHFQDASGLWHGSAQHRWYNAPFELEYLEFEGGRYLAPADTDRYLRENYGNWQVPAIFWDVSFDTPNRVFPQRLETLFMLLDYAGNRTNRFRAQHALIALRENFGIDYTARIPSGSQTNRAHSCIIVCGDFDPPDTGELQRLEKAAELGEEVIVAVADDELLARRRGRVAQAKADYRARVAHCLPYVDSVFIDDGGDARRSLIDSNSGARLLIPGDLAAEFTEFADIVLTLDSPRQLPNTAP